VNIFYLDEDPIQCAEQHCDKHVVKMIVEYAQLLSTAHRVLDGVQYLDRTSNGRSIKRWRLQDERETRVYKATHINHPSSIWTRQSDSNYRWLHNLFCALANEYTYRYEKQHKTYSELALVLKTPPKNIKLGDLTDPTPAMPLQYQISTQSKDCYHEYYKKGKVEIAKWTKRNTPRWFYGSDSSR